MVSHPYPLRMDEKFTGWPVRAFELHSVEEDTGDGQKVNSTGGRFTCPPGPEGRGSRSTVGRAPRARSCRGNGERSTLFRRWPSCRALVLLGVHIALLSPASQSRQETLRPQRQRR